MLVMAKTPPLPDLSSLTGAEKDSLILELHTKLEAFESAVRKNSNNSSKPPSSDGLSKKTNSLRESSGKPAGGQPGHKGSTLKQAAQATTVVPHPLPAQCVHCLKTLPLSEARVSERRQVFDVPATKFDVIEHQTLEVRCHCGQVHTSTFPAGVTEAVQYGPNVRALAVHLTEGQMLPYARAAELLHDIYGLSISPGTIVSWVAEARAALQGTADLIAAGLVAAPLAHADESGLRIEGKLHWLHVVANEALTWYGVHAKRGMDAIEAHGILPKRLGVLIHDCWGPYWRLDCAHALCNAHLLRELLYAAEVTAQQWPRAMTALLLTANKFCGVARRQGDVPAKGDIAAFVTLYHAILDEGDALHPEVPKPDGRRGRAKQSTSHNLLARLRKYADAVLLFLRNPAVPFTNNEAERAVRMPKIKQKISGCYRSLEGAENFCVIRSCLDTLRKQGHGMLDVLRRAFTGDPIALACA